MLVFCPVDVAARQVDPALAAEGERQRALEGSVRDLEIALLERPYCAPSAQAQAEPEPEPQMEPPSIEDTIRQGDVEALARLLATGLRPHAADQRDGRADQCEELGGLLRR